MSQTESPIEHETDFAVVLNVFERVDANIKGQQEYMKVVLKTLRDLCEHKTLLEAPREPMEYFRDLPPLRICEACGVEEEGPYYRVLKGRAYPVKRQEIYVARKPGERCLVE